MNKIRCMGETVDPNKQYDGRKVLALIKTSFQNGKTAGYREGYEKASQTSIKHGHWIIHRMNNGEIHHTICSNCWNWNTNDFDKYCVNCGAKMDEEVDETENIKI